MSSLQEWIDVAAQTTGVHGGFASPGATQQGSDGVLATFYFRQMENEAETKRQGRPIFDEVAYVEIRIPGQRNTVVNRAVKDEDKERWPDAWARFEAKQTGFVGGTPIEQWPYLSRTRVAELRAMNIFAVEGLAALEDPGKLGPDGTDLRDRARQFLQGDEATISDLRDELAALRAELAAMKGQETAKAAHPPVATEGSYSIKQGHQGKFYVLDPGGNKITGLIPKAEAERVAEEQNRAA